VGLAGAEVHLVTLDPHDIGALDVVANFEPRAPVCHRHPSPAGSGSARVPGVFLEGTLVEKLRKLEALHAGTNVDGEREAARRAAERIRARIAELRGREEDVELHYRLPDPWTRKLFIALCRRYGLEPFRERGRRSSTIQVRAPRTFHDQTLWPEFQALSKELRAHLEELTDRVIREAIHDDVTEAPEADGTKVLPASTPRRDREERTSTEGSGDRDETRSST
jgi:hypothetical protein